MKSYNITVHVPPESTEKVLAAIGDAGAGVIGNYTHCSFITRGEGRFTAGPGSAPVTGQIGVPEASDEDKVEVVCDESKLKAVIAALIEAHPHEEVAYSVFERVDINTL